MDDPCDETLVPGSIGHKCRKIWMSEIDMSDDFSERKSVMLQLIRPLSLEKGILDSEAVKLLDQDQLSK